MGNKGFLKFIGMALAASVLTACGGGAEFGGSTGDTTGSTTGTTTGTTTPVPASVKLIASAPSLPSSASTTTSAGAVTLTAIVKDSSNNLLTGIPVVFSSVRASGTTCGGGGAVTAGGSTDTSGTAQSILSTSGDQSNQIITVSAKVGSLPADTLNIPVTGTNIQVSGQSTVSATHSASYAIKLLDSAGNGIGSELVTVTSALGNGLSSSNFTTDSTGLVTINYTGTNSGTDTLTVSAACATGQKSIQVSAQTLSFASPAINKEINFGASQPLTVQLTPAVAGTMINFSTTRGTLSAASAVTLGDGTATVNISQAAGANGAGGALVTATVNATNVSASLPVEFISITPTTLKLQASPGTVAVNQTAVITGEVRDADNNLVKNQRVNFEFTDVAVGSISPGSAVTDSQGRATVTYTASSTASAKDGVKITGKVVDSDNAPIGVNGAVTLTVAGQALRIVLGTGNTVGVSGGDTIYQLPYSVLVTDAAGNPPPTGTKVSLLVEPLAYQKGVHVHNGVSWQPVYYVNSASRQPPVTGFGCLNEDANRNGVLDGAEDFNGNNNLDPGGVASVPSSVSTDANGYAAFSVTYQRDRAYWIQVRLTAIVTVAGTENREQQTFVLPGAASDFTNPAAAPPGKTSPYGTAASCAESEAGPFVNFTTATQSVTTGNSVTVNVTLSRATTASVTVPFLFTGNGLTRGTEYTPMGLSGADTLTISAGNTTGSFTINTNGPLPFISGNTVTVTIGEPTNAEQGGTFVQQVNIND